MTGLFEGINSRFIELLIATTIGSIVGAFIARDINFAKDWFNIILRAFIAVVVLAVFFFALHKASISWGKRRKRARAAPDYPKEEEAYPEEPYPEESYSGEKYREEETGEEAEDFPGEGGTREMKL